MIDAYLELGTNLGDREAYLARALAQLDGAEGIRLGELSRVYVSKAWGGLEQPDFLNVCVQIETSLPPHGLLDVCKGIEQALGRQVRERWGPREIDIDILLMQGIDIDTPTLTIPHPRLTQRRFVLEPLSDIAPRWEIDGLPVSLLAETLRIDEPEQVCMPDEKATQRLAELRGPSK
nr:2-amino-4-hydroxy-6-hydroxymethyldihydropteridine diphosphokinase [uncultured Hyphomonas sp.]